MTDEGKLISGAEDKLVKVWNVGGSWDCVLTMPGHDDFVRTVLGLAEGKIASGSKKIK